MDSYLEMSIGRYFSLLHNSTRQIDKIFMLRSFVRCAGEKGERKSGTDKCIKLLKLCVIENACPLNSLYWNFINRHEDKLASNRRMWMPYQAWRKFDHQEKVKVLEQAEYYLSNLESL